jgi:hypothetical protein
MDLGRVLQQYDSVVRARPKVRSGFEVERTGGVIRLTGHFNFICSWDLAPGAAREAVASQAAYFRSRGEKLIWRVYEHDRPAELSDCLAEEGFEADQPGTLMIFDLANRIPEAVGPDIEIRRVTTMEDLHGFIVGPRQRSVTRRVGGLRLFPAGWGIPIWHSTLRWFPARRSVPLTWD